ncbi:MAG: hypothetical protein H6R19_2089 [Proteobacteria bacterium]|nr:hypothetical protein [Pseudomonadota bacterium]
MDRRSCLKYCGALLAGCGGGASFARAQTGDDSVQRQLRFAISIINPSATPLQNQTLWLYMPMKESTTQVLEGVRVSVPYEIQTDVLQQSVLKISIPTLPPLASKMVSVVADVRMRTSPVSSILPDPRIWLQAERFVESGHPKIQTQARLLLRDSAAETARAIYEWVGQHMKYAGYLADDLGALSALNDGRGDCTEYASLAVALARANGIPARVLGGYVADRSLAPRPEDYHNWAELHFEGAWRLLDAQKRNWLSPADQYVAFHIYRDQILNPIGLASRYAVDGQMQIRLF